MTWLIFTIPLEANHCFVVDFIGVHRRAEHGARALVSDGNDLGRRAGLRRYFQTLRSVCAYLVDSGKYAIP